MKKVIFNADDFGYSRGVNLGIIEAFKHGTVRSTTLMTNMYAFDHAVELAKQNPNLGVGVHLTLTVRQPILDTHTTIVDEDGNFFSQKDLKARFDILDLDEVYHEFNAQIKKAIDSGIRVTHLDSHHHIAAYGPLPAIMFRLAKQYHLPCRLSDPSLHEQAKEEGIQSFDHFSGQFYDDNASVEKLFEMLKAFNENNELKTIEIMSHPAYLDNNIFQNTSYNLSRMRELEVLTSPDLIRFLDENNLVLTNYLELRKQG